MTQRDDDLYLVHMRDLAEEAHSIVEDLDIDEFLANSTLRYSIAYLLLPIGEAAGRVPRDRQAQIPVPWQRIIGMRHRLAHDYLTVNYRMVWTTARDELPELIAAIEQALDD
jgi:uncharacterized protein with HEPN domain